MYLQSPMQKKAFSPPSPIASKQKTPSKTRPRKHLSTFSSRMNEEISSKEMISSMNKLDTPTKKIFSPKYFDTTNHDDSNNPLCQSSLNSPPASPIKQHELDKDCEDSVRSIRQSLWSAANDELDGLLFMKYAPILPSNYFKYKKPVLPAQKKRHQGRYTLVLDLDETLVHCSVDKVEDCDLIFPIVFNGESYKVYLKKRPYFQQFLEFVSQIFEVVIFTASQQCYADKLLNLVDPDHKLIHYRLFRQHCINVEGNFVKDLRVLGRDLSRTMIVDNSPPAFTYQINNGIPIISWYDDPFDQELLKTIHVLKKLVTVDDVRSSIKKYFRINKLIKSLKL